MLSRSVVSGMPEATETADGVTGLVVSDVRDECQQEAGDADLGEVLLDHARDVLRPGDGRLQEQLAVRHQGG